MSPWVVLFQWTKVIKQKEKTAVINKVIIVFL